MVMRNIIYQVRQQLWMQAKIPLYTAIALPHFQVYSTLVYNLPNYKTEKIQKLQNRAIRLISIYNRYTPTLIC